MEFWANRARILSVLDALTRENVLVLRGLAPRKNKSYTRTCE